MIAGLEFCMNKTTYIVGGIILLVLIATVYFWEDIRGSSLFNNNATSTVTTTGGTGEVTTPGGEVITGNKPDATTNATVAPTDTTAVVTGTVNPRGSLTSYWYEYGTTSNLGQTTGKQSVGSGNTAIQTPGYITGLTKNTTYYFRLVAENQFGRVTGAQNTVRTTEGVAAPVGSIPRVQTDAASAVARTSANLNGEVNANRASTQYWFEYGTTNNFGNTTAFTSIGNGTGDVDASATASNLDPNTTYYYRVNAQNQFGTVNGATRTFKTTGTTAAQTPEATTGNASVVKETAARLNGTVDPNGAETKYWFEYSSDSLLGSVLLKTTPQTSAGSGTNGVNAQANITGLNPDTTYYFRLVAQNSQGTDRGERMTFKTD